MQNEAAAKVKHQAPRKIVKGSPQKFASQSLLRRWCVVFVVLFPDPTLGWLIHDG